VELPLKPLAAIIAAISVASLGYGQRFLGEAKPKTPPVLRAYTPKVEPPKKEAELPPVPPAVKKPAMAEQPLPTVKHEQPFARLSLADAVGLASRHADVTSRFLWLGDSASASELANWTVLLLGHCNHLSVEAEYGRPAIVPGSGGQLLRINPADYGESFAASWEKLSNQEPYFHVRVNVQTVKVKRWVPWAGGMYQGRFYPADPNYLVQVEVDEAVKKQAALAPWLAKNDQYKAAISRLIAATGSQTPIVSGQWFIWQTGAAKDRNPGYYQFIGIKNDKDIEKLSGFDAKFMTAAKRKELLEAVSESGVSHQPRRIASFPTIGALRLWRTFDSNLALNKNNALRILDNENFAFDASEWFYSLPNGLWGFALSDAKGKLQDNVPDTVGVGPDTTSTNNDGRIHVCLSCIRCHLPFDGLQPIDGWARNLYKPPLTLRASTPDLERDLRAKYLKDLEGPLADDRRSYSRNLKELTGLEPKVYADLMTSFWAQYEAPVTIERAAREVGIPQKEFLEAILSYLKANQIADSVISSFMRIGRVPRYQFHEILPQLFEIMERYGVRK
jgi:hypothetical protein